MRKYIVKNRKGELFPLENMRPNKYLKTTTPKKGDVFIRPSGIKDTWFVEVALEDFQKRHYTIIDKMVEIKPLSKYKRRYRKENSKFGGNFGRRK